jgi:4-amino-4-deoxy-L-arabinose transferase-like glycosyltransferase
LCERHAILVLLVVACLARFTYLGHAEPDIDESWSWFFVHRVLSEGEFWKNLAVSLDTPLFAGLNVWLARSFGLSILVLRLPPALFGVLSVPLVFLLFRRLHSTRLAFRSALIAALSPYLIFYSMQARPYAQLLFFSLVYTYAFYETQAWPAAKRRLVLCVCVFLAVGSHYYALVYLAAFYGLVLTSHALAGRWRDLRREFLTGVFSLAAVVPLLLILLRRLGTLSFAYWQISDLSLPGVLVEEFLFLGTTLPGGGILAAMVNLVVVGLLLLPLVYAAFRSRRGIANQPLISLIWLIMPAMIVGLELVSRQDLLFYPRGFIPTTPFLLGYWILFTGSMPMRRWLKRLYVLLLMVPFGLSSIAVATNSPRQAFFRGRELMAEIVQRAEDHRDEFDLILIHHWWVTQYFVYYYPDKDLVRGLGSSWYREAAERGEAWAIWQDLASLPRDARLLLVLNNLATLHADPMGIALHALRSTRPIVRDFPCLEDSVWAELLYCNRMILFGPASAAEP